MVLLQHEVQFCVTHSKARKVCLVAPELQATVYDILSPRRKVPESDAWSVSVPFSPPSMHTQSIAFRQVTLWRKDVVNSDWSLPPMRTSSIAFRKLPLWGRDVVNQRLEFAINAHYEHRFPAAFSFGGGMS